MRSTDSLATRRIALVVRELKLPNDVQSEGPHKPREPSERRVKGIDHPLPGIASRAAHGLTSETRFGSEIVGLSHNL